MDNLPVSAFFMTLFFFMSFFMVETAVYATRDYQVKETLEYALSQIETNGGYTVDVEAAVKDKMKSHGLIDAGFTIEPPSQRINWGESFTVSIKGNYTYRSLNVLGTGVGNITLPIVANGVGEGFVYHR